MLAVTANGDGTIDLPKTVIDNVFLAYDSSIVGRPLILVPTDSLEAGQVIVPPPPRGVGSRCVVGIAAPLPGTLNVAVSGALVTKAVCQLEGTAGHPEIGGTIRLTREATEWDAANDGRHPAVTLLTGRINGLAVGSMHGLHIHANGDVSSPAGLAAGSHYNPMNRRHGLFPSCNRHVGDILNYQGNSELYALSQMVQLRGDLNNVIGRSLILHASVDDGSQPVGNAGARLAQCVIAVAEEENVIPCAPGGGSHTGEESSASDSSGPWAQTVAFLRVFMEDTVPLAIALSLACCTVLVCLALSLLTLVMGFAWPCLRRKLVAANWWEAPPLPGHGPAALYPLPSAGTALDISDDEEAGLLFDAHMEEDDML